MRLLILTLTILLVSFGYQPASAKNDDWVTQAEVEAAINGDTCKHYVNRARFKHRHPDQEFVVTLADGCLAAKRSLESDNPEEGAAAKEFLTRLRTLRDQIIRMNMERAFGSEYTPRTRMKYDVGSMFEPVRRVSAIGEYLIARELGLLVAYHAWLGTGPKMAGTIAP